MEISVLPLRARLAFDLGLEARAKGDHATARARFAEAALAAPQWPEAGLALASSCERLGLIEDAYDALFASLRPERPSAAAIKFLCTLLELHPRVRTVAPEVLLAVLRQDGFDLRLVGRLAIALIKSNPGFSEALWHDELFNLALRAGPNVEPTLEPLLIEWEARADLPPVFAETIARQRALNENLWSPRSPHNSAAITPFHDDVSRRVAQQYEEHPYPSWTRLNLPAEGSALEQLRRLQRAAGLPPAPDAPHVLIAGCGTGQQAVAAAAGLGAGARLLAIDLSAASLAYARAKAVEHGVAGRIEFRQADILSLGKLGETFDIIYCSGVLHHMADPLAGWRVLTGRLAPGGAMRIGLYSEAARAALDALKKRVPPDETLTMEERIRNFRHRVLAAYADDWSASGLVWTDFFTMSGCRDLLFHAHETRFTVSGIRAALDALGLIFLESESLDAWAAREANDPLAFAAMYQFWCAKPAVAVSFS